MTRFLSLIPIRSDLDVEPVELLFFITLICFLAFLPYNRFYYKIYCFYKRIREKECKYLEVKTKKNKTKDVLNYIVKNYPYLDDLNLFRLIELVYLIDWGMTKKYHRQITDTIWYLNGSIPHAQEIIDKIKNNKNIVIIRQYPEPGVIRHIVRPKNDKEKINYKSLTKEEIDVIDKVIEETETKSWLDFRTHVRSTKPITDGIEYEYFDLTSFE